MGGRGGGGLDVGLPELLLIICPFGRLANYFLALSIIFLGSDPDDRFSSLVLGMFSGTPLYRSLVVIDLRGSFSVGPVRRGSTHPRLFPRQ